MIKKHKIFANWKMNMDKLKILSFIDAINNTFIPEKEIELIICPPFVYLDLVYQNLSNQNIKIAAQDCSYYGIGSHTGDISAYMLKDIGCSYVIVGHSERRKYHSEKNIEIIKKANAALDCEIIPIVCVGETLEIKTSNETEKVIIKSLKNIPKSAIIAYEPIWSIGSGIIDLDYVHSVIKSISRNFDNEVIYGGSVTSINSAAILSINNINGLLIGKASLDSDEVISIINNIKFGVD